MTPIEEMKANAKIERAAHEARSAMVDELLEVMLSGMPDGAKKRNGQILLTTGRIHRGLELFESMAANIDGKTFDEEKSRQVLDYLTCVHVGMTEFMKQIGLEVPHGTP